jgi:flotillin
MSTNASMTPGGNRQRRNGVHDGPNLAVRSAEVDSAIRPRHPGAWREGKPAEDPEKTKSWGFLSARPSEFLIHMRAGEVRHSGQGAACFKLPWDSVAVVPTTVQRLQFVADQVTSEKVGVQVTGLAVYRIADPLVAFRMLNFSFPERAQQKLEELLSEMFVGAARRLVANLTVEACLTRRKEGIAAELMREIAPVVAGNGRPDDRTQRGWGVVIDTIEIQDVRVLSETVFGNLQARYRNEQEQKAREAELHRERAVRQQEAEAQRQIALTQVASEAEIRHSRQEAEEQAALEAFATRTRVEQARLSQERQAKEAQVQVEQHLKRLRAQAEEQARLEELAAASRLEEAKLQAARALAQARAEAEVERVRLEAEAEAARHAAKLAEVAQAAERARGEAEVARARQEVAQAELATYELTLRREQLAEELALWKAKALREIQNAISPEAVQLAVAEKLPELARAFQQNMGEVHVTAVDGSNPFGYIAAAMEGVMGLARSAGLELPKRTAAEKPAAPGGSASS